MSLTFRERATDSKVSGNAFGLCTQRRTLNTPSNGLPLAPSNEQINGPSDAWLVWVKNEVARSRAR